MLLQKEIRFTNYRKATELHAAVHGPFIAQRWRNHLPGHRRRSKPISRMRRNWGSAMPSPPSLTASRVNRVFE
jgi:hypothetical protein